MRRTRPRTRTRPRRDQTLQIRKRDTPGRGAGGARLCVSLSSFFVFFPMMSRVFRVGVWSWIGRRGRIGRGRRKRRREKIGEGRRYICRGSRCRCRHRSCIRIRIRKMNVARRRCRCRRIVVIRVIILHKSTRCRRGLRRSGSRASNSGPHPPRERHHIVLAQRAPKVSQEHDERASASASCARPIRTLTARICTPSQRNVRSKKKFN
jgi:hypothetical protein